MSYKLLFNPVSLTKIQYNKTWIVNLYSCYRYYERKF